MTDIEAINELKEMKTDAWTDHRQMEAIDMAIDQKLKSIPQILEDIVSEMCDKYCKWPEQWMTKHRAWNGQRVTYVLTVLLTG